MKKDFDKGIKDFQEIRLTDAEKKRILEHIFAKPIPSPYYKYSTFRYLEHSRAFVFVVALVLVSGGVTFASQGSVPGQKLYPIKTQLVEPLIGSFNITPEKELSWEEEKIQRRIKEAEKLAAENKLDDKNSQVLEDSIVKSSNAYADAIDKVVVKASSTKAEKTQVAKKLKDSFKQKLEEDNEATTTVAKGTTTPIFINSRSASTSTKDDAKSIVASSTRARVKKLKDAAVRTVVERKDKSDDEEDK